MAETKFTTSENQGSLLQQVTVFLARRGTTSLQVRETRKLA